jgi:hypothetical protein
MMSALLSWFAWGDPFATEKLTIAAYGTST